MPRDAALERIKASIRQTYGRKGEEVVRQNIAAVNESLAHLHGCLPEASATPTPRPVVWPDAPAFVQEVTRRCSRGGATRCRSAPCR
jgi:pyruvate-ferredoxin/flavodoxin oxidoreductase